MSEDELQASVEGELERYHYLWFHDKDARRNRAGLPDVMAVHPTTGYLILAELKKEDGRVRQMQAKWLQALQLHTRPHFYVGIWRPRHWATGHIQAVIKFGSGGKL
jgi:hypothetical protein